MKRLMLCCGLSIAVLIALALQPLNAQTPKGEVVLTRVTIADIVESIRADGLVRLNYIEPAYSSGRGLSVSDRIHQIEAVPIQERTQSENSQLSALRRSAENNGANLITGYPYERFDTVLPVFESPIGVLSALSSVTKRLAPSFEVVDLNGATLIMEKGCQEAEVQASLSLTGASPKEALEAFKKMLKPLGIGFADIGFSDKYLPLVKGDISLSLNEEPIPVVLTRVTQAFGNDLVWTIRGQDGFRMIQFTQSPIPQ